MIVVVWLLLLPVLGWEYSHRWPQEENAGESIISHTEYFHPYGEVTRHRRAALIFPGTKDCIEVERKLSGEWRPNYLRCFGRPIFDLDEFHNCEKRIADRGTCNFKVKEIIPTNGSTVHLKDLKSKFFPSLEGFALEYIQYSLSFMEKCDFPALSAANGTRVMEGSDTTFFFKPPLRLELDTIRPFRPNDCPDPRMEMDEYFLYVTRYKWDRFYTFKWSNSCDQDKRGCFEGMTYEREQADSCALNGGDFCNGWQYVHVQNDVLFDLESRKVGKRDFLVISADKITARDPSLSDYNLFGARVETVLPWCEGSYPEKIYTLIDDRAYPVEVKTGWFQAFLTINLTSSVTEAGEPITNLAIRKEECIANGLELHEVIFEREWVN